MTITHQDQAYPVEDFDPRCGNVHFPPNGTGHYDYRNMEAALASCEGFGLHERACGEDARQPPDLAGLRAALAGLWGRGLDLVVPEHARA